MCKGCLAHPCAEVCPKHAISMVNGHSYIDQEKCVHCGKCKSVCPYDAISKKERPCSRACGVKAIGSDARRDIEDMLEMKVNLKLFVKVRKDWRDSDLYMKNFGYHEDEK